MRCAHRGVVSLSNFTASPTSGYMTTFREAMSLRSSHLNLTKSRHHRMGRFPQPNFYQRWAAPNRISSQFQHPSVPCTVRHPIAKLLRLSIRLQEKAKLTVGFGRNPLLRACLDASTHGNRRGTVPLPRGCE